MLWKLTEGDGNSWKEIETRGRKRVNPDSAAHPSVPRLPFPDHGQRPSASHNNPGPANPSLPYAPRLRPPASGPPPGNIPGGHGQSHAQGTRCNRPPEHVVEPMIPHADHPLVSRNNPGPAHHSLPYAPCVCPPGPPSGNIQGGQGQPHAQGTRRNPAPEQIVDSLDRLSLGQSGPRDTTSHPVPSQSHSAEDSNFEELHKFFGSADQVAKTVFWSFLILP
ncbi:hypothetical protein JB92DRAFT_3106191 [Gautieria morchelliformis]|nr:hypothetical protein JB92DRAFT_3106191 [Gautieria morchelliformis]